MFGIFWIQNWHKMVHFTLKLSFLKFHILHYYLFRTGHKSRMVVWSRLHLHLDQSHAWLPVRSATTYHLSLLSYKKPSICLLKGYLLLTQSSFVFVHLISYLKNIPLFSLEFICFKKDICCWRIFSVLIHFDFLFKKRSSYRETRFEKSWVF